MAIEQNGTIPAWLDKITLEQAVRENLGELVENVVSIQTGNIKTVGENSSSLLIQINADVKLKDGSKKTPSFVLKTLPSNPEMAKLMNSLNLFTKEEQMYYDIIPKFESFYKEVGKKVQFAPKAYKLDRGLGVDYILLDDLRERQHKNAHRINGLNMEHVKAVLTKLAEFHAASAYYVEHFGIFGEDFTEGIYTEDNSEMLKKFNSSEAFLNHLKKWKDGEKYFKKLADSDKYLVTRLLEDQRVNMREFNVLNHGDLWTNNIMFQYDAFGKIKHTLFVDFQVCKYGSPANDLYYFLLTSTAKDIKLTQFEYFVRFYYDHLISYLKLLKYHRPLPKIKSIYISLLNNGLTAYLVASKVLPVVLLDKPDQAIAENSQDYETKLKTTLFTNHRYVQVMAELLPWLDNRGLLDWK